MRELMSIAYDICREAPPETIFRLGEILDQLDSFDIKRAVARMNSELPAGNYIDKVKILFSVSALNSIESPSVLAAILKSMTFAIEKHSNDMTAEVVWTGPQLKGHPLRRTDSVLEELISSAKKEILIVSFVVYKTDEIASKLIEALNRGVTVSFILESSSDSEGRLSFDGISSLGNELISRANLYYWPREKREEFAPGQNSSLHIKCAIVDQREMLISSANLTRNALEFNMEMGLRIINKNLAKKVNTQFLELIANKILIRR